MSSKNVLFTSAYFKGYAGSELATLEQAEEFLHMGGWNVYVFALVVDSPLLDRANGIKVVDTSGVNESPKHFDLIISRQYPLLDYILFRGGVRADRVYYESVGYAVPWDAFPIYYRDLTMTGSVSELAKAKMAQIGFETDNTYVYPNSAPTSFFQANYQCREQLNKIAVVSNHVPPELREYAELAKTDGMEVSFYGHEDNYVLIRPEILSKYDAVISIGKTVYYALAMGMPVYMYDRNVSEGYVTPANYTSSLTSNFAKKDTYCEKSPEQIMAEIKMGYGDAVSNSISLKERARTDFASEKLLASFLEEINKRPKMNYEALGVHWRTLSFTSSLFVEEFDRRERNYNSIETYLKNEIAKHYETMQREAKLKMRCDELSASYEELERRYDDLEARYQKTPGQLAKRFAGRIAGTVKGDRFSL